MLQSKLFLNKESLRTNENVLFAVEDLPYAKYRIYMRGTNTPYDPWYLSDVIPPEKKKRIDESEWKKFVIELNQVCTYNMTLKLFLDIVFVLYCPLYFALVERSQKKILMNIRRFINTHKYVNYFDDLI